MDPARRQFLRLGGIAAAGAIAGCSTETATDTPEVADDGDSEGGSTPAATATPAPASGGAEFDFGGWLSDTSNYDGVTVDMRDNGTVTVDVGASANGGGFGFAPPAVWVDSGTELTWEWTGEGGAHNVVAESGADFRSGDATSDSAATFSQTVDGAGVVTYFCNPHRSMGMKGAIVVGDPDTSETATQASGEYGFQAASFDAYWYSLYNMSTNIAMSANGVTFPQTEEQKQTFQQRMSAIARAADVDSPPVVQPDLNMAPFTEGDPHFTEQPVLSNEDGKPDASTLTWDSSESSGVVSPSALAWTHLKGVTWVKNFENHFDILPTESIAPKFRSQVLSTVAQLGVKFSLVDGRLRANDENMLLVSGFDPVAGEVVDSQPRLGHQSAMLWFLSDLVSLAQGGWFGYENPDPLIPATKLQKMTDSVAKTTMNAFAADSVFDAGTTRDVGELLGAMGWYGTHAGNDELQSAAAEYANGLAGRIADTLAGNGKVRGGLDNQAATQGIVAQGLLWASQVDGVDHTDTAEDVIGYLVDELWDPDAGTFKPGSNASTYTITARDAGDVTGGLNAADAVLGRSDARETFATFFNQTFNRGRLQRAERPPSHSESAAFTLPLPPAAGGEFGQAAVYNSEVEYDPDADEWSVTDPRFRTADALYLANQDIWVGNWGGDFFQGRGVPGENDSPE
jgi:halocyanin-like protein